MQENKPIYAQLFGSLQLAQGVEKLPLPPSTAARALLAYLLLHRERPSSRDTLLGLFWPEHEETRARRALTQALWQIRRAVPGLIQTSRATISIPPDALLTVDVTAFASLVRPQLESPVPTSVSNEPAAAELRQAIALVGGEFLEGFYDNWVLLERERLRELYLQAMERLIQLDKLASRYEQALDLAIKLAQVDPLREAAHREVMRLYVALERPQAALQQYRAYGRILAEELDAQPDEETRALAEAIARRPDVAGSPFVPGAVPRQTAVALNPAAHMPLIGREPERAALLRHITAVFNNRGGILFLSGESGVGKSRLLQEIAQDAEWRGAQVVWGYGQEMAAVLPYDPLAQALRSALSPLRIQQVRRLLPDIWLATAAQLLPALSAALPNLAPPPPLPSAQEQIRLLEALARLALALGELTPLVFILEDLHWADPATFDALTYLARRLSQSHILFIGSYRPQGAREKSAVWAGLQAVDAAGIRQRLPLAPLDPDATGELVRQGLGLSQDAPLFAGRLHQQSKGNPLLILETLRALHDQGLLYQDEQGAWHTPYDETTADYAELSIPAAGEQLVRRRLERLSPETRQVAHTAAVIGREVDFLLLEAAVPLDTRTTLVAISTLVQRQFLEETPRAYRFSHDKVRQAVMADIPPPQRPTLHRQVARALETLQPDQVETLAYHFTQADARAQALHYHQLAAEQARRANAHHTAVSHLNQAVDLAGGTDLAAAELFDLLAARETIYDILGCREEQAADLAKMEQIARHNPARQAETLRRHARLGIHLSHFAQAIQNAQRALSLAQQTGDEPGVGAAEIAWGEALFMQGDTLAALPHYQKGLVEFQATADSRGEAGAHLAIANARRTLSDYAGCQAALQAALDLYQRDEDKPNQAEAYTVLGTLRMEQGNVEAATENFQRALALAKEVGHRYREAAILTNWGNLLWMQGQIARTIQQYERASRIFADIGHARGQALLSTNLASIQCTVLGEYEKATANLQSALAYYRQTEDRVGSGQCLAVMGAVAGQQGDFVAARRHLEESISALNAAGEKFICAQALRELALLAVRENNPANALENLEQALNICRETGMADLATSLSGIRGMALLAQGKKKEAFTATWEAMARLKEGVDQGYLIPYWHAQVLQAQQQEEEAGAAIEQAYEMLAAYLDGLSPEQRKRSLEQIPDNKAITAAWKARQGDCRTVRLPRAGAPTGRPLRPDERVGITWTVGTPADAGIKGKKARRHHRLRRLLSQAAQQGAAPTIQDLAQSLDVSAGTIKRDLADLRRAGQATPTRGGRLATGDLS